MTDSTGKAHINHTKLELNSDYYVSCHELNSKDNFGSETLPYKKLARLPGEI